MYSTSYSYTHYKKRHVYVRKFSGLTQLSLPYAKGFLWLFSYNRLLSRVRHNAVMPKTTKASMTYKYWFLVQVQLCEANYTV